jgi:anaerobic selenocysteine-containing dehydrogenase
VNEISAQLKGVGDVLMNTATARKRGIKDGDEIWIESPPARSSKQSDYAREYVRIVC